MTHASGQTGTILLVDDEEVVLSLVSQILTGDGYEVLRARSGKDSLRICREHPGAIDLVLTDIVMPDRNGGQVAREIKTMRPDTRILFMSGYTKYTFSEQGSLESVDSFIWKPFSSEQLLGKVHEMLDLHPDSR